MEQIKSNTLVIENSNKNSENELEQKKDKVSINSNNDKPIIKYINLIKDYFSLISFSIFAILLILDYFIFTEVLNLNQAYFFNNLLGEIAQEQPILLIFVLFPIIFLSSIFITLYKIQFSYLNKFFNDNYKNSYNIYNRNKFKIFLIFFSVFIILFGDIIIFFLMYLIYYLLENTPFTMTALPFLFTTYFLFLIYNSIVFYLILIISSKFIIKFKNILLTSFLLGFFISLKLGIYPFLQFIPYLKEFPIKSFAIFTLFNLLFFIPAIMSILGSKFKEKKEEKDKNKRNKISTLNVKILLIILITFSISFYFYNLNKIYHEPYIKKDFWNNFDKNNLFNSNISLLISPLKILKDTENEMDIKIDDIKKKFIKKFNDKTLNDKFNSNLNYFYLPFKDYRIIFIQDTNENIILTAYTLFKDDKLVKILDVGFIDLNAN